MRVIVTGLGIDKGDGEYVVSAQVARIAPGQDAPGSNAEIDVISASASTLVSAMSKLSYQTGKIAAYSHASFVVFGKEMLNENMASTLDYFVRNKVVKSSTMVLCCDSNAVDELKKTKQIDLSVGLGLQKVYMYRESESEGKMTTALEFLRSSKEFGGGSLVSELQLVSHEEILKEALPNSKSEDESGGSQKQDEKKQKDEKQYFKADTPLVCFKNGKFVGKLEGDENLLGFMLINNKAQKCEVVLNLNDEQGNPLSVTVSIKRKKCRTSVRFENGTPVFDVQIKIKAAEIDEIIGEETNNFAVSNFNEIENELKNMICEKISKMFLTMQGLEIDVLKAYEIAYKFNYYETTKLFKTPEEFLKKGRVSVSVQIDKLEY